jgi:hypothetical protein
MNMAIALVENEKLSNVVQYGPFETWAEYDGFVARNFSQARPDQHLITILTVGGVVIHSDHYNNGKLTNVI